MTLADGVRLACGVGPPGQGVAAIRPEKITREWIGTPGAREERSGRARHRVKRKMAHVEVVVDAGIDLVVLPRAGERETPGRLLGHAAHPPEAIRLLPRVMERGAALQEERRALPHAAGFFV